jgi:hypothetical protein
VGAVTPRIPLTEWQTTATPAVLPHHVRRNIVEGNDGCWLWTRSRSRDGYGWASLHNRTHQAHRLIFEIVSGPVPDGLILDHTCRVRHCVNPAHLEPVTPGENLRRSPLTPAGMERCAKGHEFSQWYRQRRCLICFAEYKQRKAAA